jgi:hypothetical protein
MILTGSSLYSKPITYKKVLQASDREGKQFQLFKFTTGSAAGTSTSNRSRIRPTATEPTQLSFTQHQSQEHSKRQ